MPAKAESMAAWAPAFAGVTKYIDAVPSSLPKEVKPIERSGDGFLAASRGLRYRVDFTGDEAPDLRRWGLRRRCQPVEGGERGLDARPIHALGDHDQARLWRAIGPGCEVGWRVDRVLHTVNHHGGRHAGDVKQAFYPQDGLAMAVEQHGQPDGEGRPLQRLVQPHRERDDIVAMTADVVAATMIAAMVMPGEEILLLSQPPARFLALCGGIIDIAGEQSNRRHRISP